MTAAKKTSTSAKTKRARARNASMLEGPFQVEDLKFRPFTAASPDHLEALGIADALQQLTEAGEEGANDNAWLNAILGVAWTLHAPLDEINDLCFAIAEADTEEERAELRKGYRRTLMDFKSRLSVEGVEKVAKHINRIFTRNFDLEFETEERDSGLGGGEKKSPAAGS